MSDIVPKRSPSTARRARRDLVIVAARRAGIPARWIADALGITHPTVLAAEHRAEDAFLPRADFLSLCDIED